jgi:hypothetical protein
MRTSTIDQSIAALLVTKQDEVSDREAGSL